MLALLPKCPLCIAVWLTAFTGMGFSATGAAWVRGLLVVLCATGLALAAVSILRRARASTVLKSSQPRCCIPQADSLHAPQMLHAFERRLFSALPEYHGKRT
jgi:hypothetical protein